MWTMTNLFVWIIVGGAAGWLSRRAIRGTGLGLLGDIVVGILGAFLGAFVLSLVWPSAGGFTGFTFGSLMIAFVGAMVLLLVVRVFFRRLRQRPSLEQQLKLDAQAKWLSRPM